MADGAGQGEQAAERRLRFVLQQLDGLPTLSSIATRLMQLTADDDTEIQEIVELVSSDPAPATRVLKLCQCHPRGRATNTSSLERAVILIGIDALRAAVLSVQVFQAFEQAEAPDEVSDAPVFDRIAYWHHSLATAVLSEGIVEAAGLLKQIAPGEAYLAGLLHDLGMLALHAAMPEQFEKIIESAERLAVSCDQACLKVLGTDTHTAGKRLADQWGLPADLRQVIWLCGQSPTGIPDDQHRQLILVVSLADAIARRWYVTPAAHGPRGEMIEVFAGELEISDIALQRVVDRLDQRVRVQADALGLDGPSSPQLLLQSVCRANAALGRMNVRLREQSGALHVQRRALSAIELFLNDARTTHTVLGVLTRVARSAAAIDRVKLLGMLHQTAQDEPWQMMEHARDGRPLRQRFLKMAPSHMETLLDPTTEAGGLLVQPNSELLTLIGTKPDATVRGVQLECPPTGQAVLLFEDEDPDETWRTLGPLLRAWQRELASAARQEAAGRIGEELALANRVLAETREELARAEAQAAIGEIAAGAAHEMNNPLTIISGRSQLLVSRLQDPETRAMAGQIVEQSHRLSDMITALRLFADPPRPRAEWVKPESLVASAAQMMRQTAEAPIELQSVVPSHLPPVEVDAEQLSRALGEVLRNASESPGCRHIQLRVQMDLGDDRWTVQVTDDGRGLSSTALAHAFDPFFSEKTAGRQPGLGLAQARRIIEAHGGIITLKNVAPQGAQVTITLPLRLGDTAHREVA